MGTSGLPDMYTLRPEGRFEPVRHQICNPQDSFDLRCESVTYSIVHLQFS